MSLARTALRLTALEAVRPTAAAAANGPWPTLAGGNFFDSRLDPIDNLDPQSLRPVGVVYTEFDDSDPMEGKHGSAPMWRNVDLTFELAIVARTDDGTAPELYEAGVPETDAELESSLDLFEGQVRFALLYGDTGALWRKLTGVKIKDIRSNAHRTSEEQARLAMRTLVIKVMVPDDCYKAAPAATPTGLDRLPDPLKTVVKALGETSYGRKIGEGLAASAPFHPVPVRLQSVALNIDVANPQGERDDVADVQTTAPIEQ